MQPLRATPHSLGERPTMLAQAQRGYRPAAPGVGKQALPRLTARKFRRDVQETSSLRRNDRAPRPKAAPCVRVHLLQSTERGVGPRPSRAPYVMTVHNEGV